MTLTFGEKLAVVTGAGRGIGKAIAEKLAQGGLKVICISRSEGSCGAAADAINAAGGSAVAMAVDVGDREAVAAASEQILKDHGTVEVLVNNAGITKDNLLVRMSDDEWHDVIQTNLNSCFYWCRALAQPMARARYGRIVNITSVSGLMGNAGQTNYAAAKAGMIGFTKSLAKELAKRKITANCVAPGFINTDMTAALSDEIAETVKKIIPMQRMGEVQEIADTVAFLCSEQASYITGQVFTVDGGLVM